MMNIQKAMSILNNMKISKTETYGDHKIECPNGCLNCMVFHKQEQAFKLIQEKTNLDADSVSKYRERFYHGTAISDYFPNKNDFFDEQGQMRGNSYLVLRLKDFSDTAISRYFHINVSLERQKLFPDWKSNENYYLNEAAIKAWKAYKQINRQVV